MTIANKITFFSLLALLGINSVFAQPAARVGDATGGGGEIQQGSPTVLIEGRPAARKTDKTFAGFVGTTFCGTGAIDTGSATVLINGMAAARTGDIANKVCGSKITTGSPTVSIGD